MAGRKDRAAALLEASLLLAVLFLGTNPVAVKVAVAEFPPLPFVAMRFTLAGLLLLALVALLEQGNGRPGRRDLLSLAGVGLVGVGANNVAFTHGVSMTTASETALIYAAVPIWGILLGLALGLERPTPWGILGVCLAFLGVAVVVYGGLTGSTSLLGNLLIVVATVCWGAYAVLSLPLLRRYSPLVVASYTMLFGGLGALPFALPGFLDAGWAESSGEAWGALAYSTLLVAAFGFWAWQRGVSQVGANRVLIYQYLITLVGVAAGVLLLGESLTANKVLGGAVILLGVYLARRR
ncbi:MAG TPA: DMT family transporter [Rubrobacter sp.]|jgi:drug/metabolite transporter (DMT)-like permease|nr:DMT family transporter [Rubrobacter sp.]